MENNVHTYLLFFVYCTLGLLLSHAASAQRVSVTIRGTDSIGSDSVVIGNDPAATNHIDLGLGEEELPVVTPTFDFRTVAVSSGLGKDTTGSGQKVNFHYQQRPTQDDRWRLQFQSDSFGTAVEFSWNPGLLAAAGGGGWRLENAVGVPYLDMTTTDHFQFPGPPSQESQYIFVHAFDSYRMTSIPPDSIALARNEKNKAVGKPVQRKNWAETWCFTLPNATGQTANGLHMEFGKPILSFDGNEPFTSALNVDGGKNKKYDFTGDTVPDGQTARICGMSKGVKLKGTYWWTLDGQRLGNKLKFVFLPDGKPETVDADAGSYQRLPMPNWWNVVDECLAQGFPEVDAKGKPIGIRIGMKDAMGIDIKGKPVFKTVIHPKYGDVFKSLWYKKFASGHTGVERCLNLFDGRDGLPDPKKPINKQQKSLPPSKHNNRLFGEALALRIAVVASDLGKIPTGFGDLIFDDSGSPLNASTPNPLSGQKVRDLSADLDTVLSCVPLAGSGPKSGATYSDWYQAVHAINNAFLGPFDTVSFGNGTKVPPPNRSYGFTQVTGMKMVSEVPYLYRQSAEIPPRIDPPYRYDVNAVPSGFELEQNYPNPFNPSTTIEFVLPYDAVVTVTVYNVLGQEVARLADHEEFTSGSNEVTFDASNLSSGVYFYRIMAEDKAANGGVGKTMFTSVKKMMLVK